MWNWSRSIKLNIYVHIISDWKCVHYRSEWWLQLKHAYDRLFPMTCYSVHTYAVVRITFFVSQLYLDKMSIVSIQDYIQQHSCLIIHVNLNVTYIKVTYCDIWLDKHWNSILRFYHVFIEPKQKRMSEISCYLHGHCYMCDAHQPAVLLVNCLFV